jgi:hypothetical protein
MATFIKGTTDEFGPMQLYKPDYQFLTKVYGTKQAEYDRGFNYVKSLYNSSLNDRLTSEDNERYRQEAFKKIQNTLKDASTLDLSNAANIGYAQEAIDPISGDKQLAYDMQVSKIHSNELQKLEMTRSSLDPKISSQYNEFSRKAIQFATEDLKGAKRNDGSIFKVSPQKFIPYQDIVGDLNQAAKDQKLDIEIDSVTGTGYITKQTNGQLAYKPFTKWAMSIIGNKYDAQLQQQGYVQGESLIRSTMQQEGLSREDALNTIAPSVLKQLYNDAVTNGSYTDAKIKEFDLEISKFRDKYGSSGINPNSKEGQALAAVQKKKKEYVDELASNKAEILKMEEEGTSYVTSNLYNILTNQAKKTIALDWAVGHADVTKKFEIKPDTTWSTKFHEANANARHQQDINMRAAALAETQRNNRFNNEIAMFKLKYGDTAKLPSEQNTGTALSTLDEKLSVTLPSKTLNNDLNKVQTNMFNQAFASSDGLINILYNSDKNDLEKVTPIISKMRAIAAGQNIKLTEAEIKTITDFGNRSGVAIYNPKSPQQAAYALRQMSYDVYEQASKKIAMYKNTKNTKDIAGKLKHFTSIRDSFKQFANVMDNIEQNYEAIAKNIVDVNGNIKEMYSGAKVVGFTSKNTPMFDLSALTPAMIASASRNMTKNYTDKTMPAGSTLVANNIKPEEYQQFFRYNTNLPENEKTLLRTTLSPERIKEFYGSSVDITYDLGTEEAIITMKGDNKKIKDSKSGLQNSYEFRIPYSQIRGNAVLSRLNKYLDANTLTSTNTSTLNPLMSNPNAIVNAPSEIKNGLGLDYQVMGGTDAAGNYGIHIIGTVENVISGKLEKFNHFETRKPGQSQQDLIKNAEKSLVQIQNNYQAYKIQMEESYLSDKDNMEFESFLNNIE